MRNLIQHWGFVTIATIITMCLLGCSEKDTSDLPSGSNSTDTPGGNQTYLTLSLEEQSAGYLSVLCEPKEGVAYYKIGKGSLGSQKYTARKVFKYNGLNPLTEYTFCAEAYDSTDAKLGKTITQKYSTTAAPYSNYFRPMSAFYPLYSAEMRKDNLSNGYSQKVFHFQGDYGYWMQIRWTSYAYETIDSYFAPGTYQIGAGGDGNGHHCYVVLYNAGSSNINYIYEGTIEIKQSGNVMHVTITDSYGMKCLDYAGTI